MILPEVKYRQIHNGVFVNARLIHHNHAGAAADGQSTKKPVEISQTNVAKTQCRVPLLAATEYPGIPLNPIYYASLLQACTDMKSLEQTHAHLAICGLDQSPYLETRLVSMYALLGSLDNARELFDKILEPNVFAWNSMIRRYATSGSCEEALCFYYRMQQAGIHPDNLTFPFVLRACAGLLALREGYAQNGHASEALALFGRMQLEGMTPDSVTMVSILSACGQLGAMQQGKCIHDYVIKNGFESDPFVGTALIDMYSKCGSMDFAHRFFGGMPERNVVSWNALIAGYAQVGHASQALTLVRQMQLAGFIPDSVTVVSLLSACAYLGDLRQGKCIHDYIIRNGFESDVSVGNSLVNMYAKCGDLDFANQLFHKISRKDVVSWNSMIAAYDQNGQSNRALALFHQMQMENVIPDRFTMISVIPACAHVGDLQQGKWIHECIIRNRFESDIFVGTSLIDMYANCGRMEKARQLFNKMSEKNVVSWNTMIAGYTHNGPIKEALALYYQMQVADMTPDSVTLVSVLSACAQSGALQQGKCMHDYILRKGFESEVSIGNSLVAMYAKCGRIESAQRVFDKMSERNVVSWSSLIAGYGMHGHGKHALRLFGDMLQTGTKPNHITFVSVLSACSHAGLVDDGWHYLDSMSQDYCITPGLEHYACMVDILGRAGHLDEAQDFIQKMPLEPDAGVWGALLGACRIHCNIELGERVAKHLFHLEPENPGYYVLLSNIYAAVGRWHDVAKVRTMMKDRGLKKPPGCTFIELNNKLHSFVGGDRSHPQSEQIYATLEALAGQMKEAGYVPSKNFVLYDLEDEEKDYMLCSHSEKLAIAFGLINTSPRTTIQITKNLRVCGDCHTVTKFISKIEMREIVVRDATRFHQFKDGFCTCGDYW